MTAVHTNVHAATSKSYIIHTLLLSKRKNFIPVGSVEAVRAQHENGLCLCIAPSLSGPHLRACSPEYMSLPALSTSERLVKIAEEAAKQDSLFGLKVCVQLAYNALALAKMGYLVRALL